MKRMVIALLLTLAAGLSGIGIASADTDDGHGIVGTQAP